MLNDFLFDAVVVANGDFATNKIQLNIIKSTKTIICCDGAIEKLDHLQIQPFAIIGDGDSISTNLKKKYSKIFHIVPDQETNDLTKAVNFCISNNYSSIAIVGATGFREDHTIGNISLLATYAQKINCRIFSNYGFFSFVNSDIELKSFPKQQVSIFSLSQDKPLSVSGLRYPIQNHCFKYWWEGTLNEALSNSFKIFTNGEIIVFQTYEPKI